MNVYGIIPEHLSIEDEAIERVTKDLNNLGLVCLLTQIDKYDSYYTIDTIDKYSFIIVDTQEIVRDNKLIPLVGLIKKGKDKQVGEEIINTNMSFINLALQYLNTPYVWGGKSKDGTDCSGLIYQIYRDRGILLPRFCDGQYKVTKEVDELIMGDLIFIFKEGKARHVLMYLMGDILIESCGVKVFNTRLIKIKDKFKTETISNRMNINNGYITFNRYK